MSGTDAILEASNVLRRLIATGRPDGAGNLDSVRLGSPVLIEEGTARFSLWLYRVIENEHQKNIPPQRIQDQANASLRRAPLVLDLYYLLTPFGGNEERRQERLGEAMQRLYARPIIELASGALGAPGAIREELHIQLFRMALEELTRIWEALQQPLRLSVVYQVRLVRIDVEDRPAPAPVTDRRIGQPLEETPV